MKVIFYYGGFKFVYGGVNSHIKLIESGLSEVVKLHNQLVEDGSYYESHPEIMKK